MLNHNDITKGYGTAEARWARFGPYYAMFPLEFAVQVINKYSNVGDHILDPFAGRGSSIYAGGVLGRKSYGIEINPVGWLFGTTKLNPADKGEVIKRLKDVYSRRELYGDRLSSMPEFFRMCFSDEVLKFLLSLKDQLDWRSNNVDATLISIVLVYLHGKIGASLSNQMQITKSMGMIYSVSWWKKMKLISPPDINPYEFILNKINWRYEKGIPKLAKSEVILGDCINELSSIKDNLLKEDVRFSLLFTSPPYYSITNYHADQWLRLWLLGCYEDFNRPSEKNTGRFDNMQEYYNLLDEVFCLCSRMMKRNSTVYVRTDKREFTFNTTLKILKKYFPKHSVQIHQKPVKKKTRTQTQLFNNKCKTPGEVDIILIK